MALAATTRGTLTETVHGGLLSDQVKRGIGLLRRLVRGGDQGIHL